MRGGIRELQGRWGFKWNIAWGRHRGTRVCALSLWMSLFARLYTWCQLRQTRRFRFLMVSFELDVGGLGG